MFKQSRILVFIFLAISTFMVISAVLELEQSRKELRSLMENQSRALLKVLLQTANNSLETLDFLEDESISKINDLSYIRRELGFGKLCRKTARRNKSIIYIALQDTVRVLAASQNLPKLKNILTSDFLTNSYFNHKYSFRILSFDSLEIFETVTPLIYNGKKIGLFRLGLSTNPLREIDRRTKRRLFIISIIIIIIGTLIFYFIYIRFKNITELRALEKKLERSKRLSAMGELSSGVAHEIRNPLNAISTIIQQLAKDFRPQNNSKEYIELTTIVRGEINRIDKTVQDFLKFSKDESILKSKFNLNEFFNEIKKQFSQNLLEKSITLECETTVNNVNLDRDKIKQVIINLILNSTQAISTSGKIKIVANKILEERVEIIVSDDGSGIDEKILPNIFNLYFTTRAKGSGIGLSMVQRIVHSHGGTITIENNHDKGSKARIVL